MLRRTCAVALLLLTGACGGSDPSSAPSSSASPSASPSASTAAPSGPARLLAVARSSGPLEVYGLTGHAAVKVQTLPSPDAAARVVSLSEGGDPAVAKDPEPKVYVRYAAADSRGTQITGLPDDVAAVVTPS